MIDFDTSRLPMGATEWTAFLDAVYAAAPEDESEWIEWKSTLDLDRKESVAILAKAIVAFANRAPADAARWMEGRGLVLVGMEPGNALGVTPRDPADLDTALRNLLGATGPRFELRWLTYRSVEVLVVEVAAPQPGDPIYAIVKSSGSVTDGDVYVRRPGRSTRATSADLAALSVRLFAAPADGLDLDVSVDVDGGLRRTPRSETTWVESWLRREREFLMRPYLADQKPDFTDYRNPLAGLKTNRLAGTFFADIAEDRDPDDYVTAVEVYLDSCREALPAAPIPAAVHLTEPITLRVTNRTDQNFESLEVHLHIEGEVEAFEPNVGSLNPRNLLTGRPRRWGPRPNPDLARIAGPQFFPGGLRDHIATAPSPRPHISNGGSTDLILLPVHLRPFATEIASEDEIVLVTTEMDVPALRATWYATATNVAGRAEGAFEIPLLDEPLDLGSALRWTAPGNRAIRTDLR